MCSECAEGPTQGSSTLRADGAFARRDKLRTTRPSETHEAHDANVVSRFVGFLLNTDKILVRHSVQRSAYTVIANYLVVSCGDEKSPTLNDTFARGKRHRVRSLAHRRGPGGV